MERGVATESHPNFQNRKRGGHGGPPLQIIVRERLKRDDCWVQSRRAPSFLGTKTRPAYSYAMIHDGLGDKEKALAYLEQSLQEREVGLTFIKIDSG